MQRLEAQKAKALRPEQLPEAPPTTTLLATCIQSNSTGRVEAGVKSSQQLKYKGWSRFNEGKGSGKAAWEVEASQPQRTLEKIVAQERLVERHKYGP